MSTDSFWLCIETLATALDGGRAAAEKTIDRLEREIMARTPADRDDIRQRIIVVVAGLSRLEVRLMSSAGPNSASV
jgi:hypothetical protein